MQAIVSMGQRTECFFITGSTSTYLRLHKSLNQRIRWKKAFLVKSNQSKCVLKDWNFFKQVCISFESIQSIWIICRKPCPYLLKDSCSSKTTWESVSQDNLCKTSEESQKIGKNIWKHATRPAESDLSNDVTLHFCNNGLSVTFRCFWWISDILSNTEVWHLVTIAIACLRESQFYVGKHCLLAFCSIFLGFK